MSRRTRIARFPEDIRNQINEFLDKDTQYQQIIDWLSEHGYAGIEMYHLTRWKDTGYQDWVRHHERMEELQFKREWAKELAQDQGANDNFHQAAFRVTLIHFFDALNRTDSAQITRMLESKPEKFATLVNSFANFAHEIYVLEKFKDDVRRRNQAEEEFKRISKGGLTPESLKRIREELRVVYQLPEAPEKPAPGAPQEGNCTTCT